MIKKTVLLLAGISLCFGLANAAPMDSLQIKGTITTDVALDLDPKFTTSLNLVLSHSYPKNPKKGTHKWDGKFVPKKEGDFLAGQFVYRIHSTNPKLKTQGCILAYKMGLDGEFRVWAHTIDSDQLICSYTRKPQYNGVDWQGSIDMKISLKK